MDKNGIESQYSEWDPMPRYITEKIEAAVAYINGNDDPTATIALNRYLGREGYIGKTTLLRAHQPIISAERRTPDGITEEPVFDADILGGSAFVGTFDGCSSIHMEGAGVYATYQIHFEHGDRVITVKAITDIATVQFLDEAADETDPDMEVAEAFEVLSMVDNQDYHEIVTCLREVFSDEPDATGGPGAAARLRAIGTWTTVLMQHPAHELYLTRTLAVDTILCNALDESVRYIMTGASIRYDVQDDKSTTMAVDIITAPIVIDVSNIRYVPDFELTNDTNTTGRVELSDGMQPVFVAFDIDRNRELEIPLRYIKFIDEADSWSDMASGK